MPESFACVTEMAHSLPRCESQCRECREVCPPDPAIPPLTDDEARALVDEMVADGWVSAHGREPRLRVKQLQEWVSRRAAPTLPPVGERETDGSWSDERLRSASDEDVLTLMLELRGRFALYHNEAQLEDSERCRREILRRLASHPSPAPSGERFTEEEMHYVRAVAHHWRNWAMNLNDLKRVFIGLHRKMSEMNAAAAPHSDGQGVAE